MIDFPFRGWDMLVPSISLKNQIFSQPTVVLMKFLPQGYLTSSRQLELAMDTLGAATSATVYVLRISFSNVYLSVPTIL